MIELWSAIAVAILTVVVGPLVRGEVGNRLQKRVAGHVQLREHLVGNTDALKSLDALLVTELQELRKREENRLTRKLNGGVVATLIFVAVAGAGIVYGLTSWAAAVQGTFLSVIIYAAAALVGLFTIALAAAGVGTLYKPKDASPAASISKSSAPKKPAR
ncbi:hypothetical protein M3667_01840 [Microbacterium sp. P26]|uniref:hypothetical protein n=1 Tax=Microbacterium TaxID=33882 RepID=UPI002040DA6F|nr:hypothetical protein [Microbacterium sp. P26]MCM3500619.1 hypothetical protein [Microbacterium sp. P26]